MIKTKLKKGFTLVELMVSVTITAIIMVGMSTFFSSTFRNMFLAQQQTGNSQSQFVVASILQQKLMNAKAIQELEPGGSYAFIKNDLEKGEKPFTYMGLSDDRIVFKDFFVFNGREADRTSEETNLENPGGMTLLGETYYVTAPLENLIYVCHPIANCDPLELPTELSQPMDITSNGVDTLYLTDAGNNRVLMITDLSGEKAVTVLDETMNYPTGIEFYQGGGTDYLFVSDTYNHLLKKITPAIGVTEVVLGDKGDADCDNTAEYCRLNFPTGLVIGDDGEGQALYIADTGSGRILKLSDPNPDLSNYEFSFDLESETDLSQISFSLPQTAQITSVKEGEGGNTLHKGRYTTEVHAIHYWLRAESSDNFMEQECTGEGDIQVCLDYFRGFYVEDSHQIFQNNDEILIGNQSFEVMEITEMGGGLWRVGVEPSGGTEAPSIPSELRVLESFSGAHSIFLNLSEVQFSTGFNPIQVEFYDQNEKLVADASFNETIRIGDGLLGTPEDQVSVYSDHHSYVTGLSWFEGHLAAEDEVHYSLNFNTFDYRSDFEVSQLNFETKNGGAILDLEYIATITQDEEGNDITQAYTLSSHIKP